MAMGVKVKVCSPLNARLFLLSLAAVSVVTIFWYMLPVSNAISETKLPTNQNEMSAGALPDGDTAVMDITSDDYQLLFAERIVHFDLKGAPTKVSYLAELFPLLKKLGATGILMEYEDMFPYEGELKVIAAGNAYHKSEIVKINTLAEENGLEIIPLVQTFGHLEFLLKLEDFHHLREVPDLPLVICPSQNHSLSVLHQMLSQVMNLHPRSKRIHIGADEVYSEMIGKCSQCRERMANEYWVTSDLFLSHVVNVATLIRDKLNRRPLMWDDEFRSISESDLHRSRVGHLVDIVVWNYSPVLTLSAETWAKYLNVFNSVWVASAFKGATGSDQVVTDIHYHMQNHLAWMSLVGQYRGSRHQVKFAGIMLTGWSRYDHFAVLCELLPVSLPSLAYNLLLLQTGYELGRISTDAGRLLRCADGPAELLLMNAGSPFSSVSLNCQFPGASVYAAVNSFVQVRQQYHKLLNNSVVRGWMTDYNVRHGFSSPTHLRGIAVELGYLKNNIDATTADLESAMDSVYDGHTVREWVETHVHPIRKAVDKLVQVADTLSSQKVWPKRPFDL